MDCAARDSGLTHDGRSDPMIQLLARTPPCANRVSGPRHDQNRGTATPVVAGIDDPFAGRQT